MAQSAGARQLMFADRPVWIGIRCFFKQPKKVRTILPNPTKSPDIDNVAKALMDGLKAAFVDDAQVVGFLPGSGKFWGEPQRVEVEITDEQPGS